MIQIKHRHSSVVLFECETPEGLASGLATRHTLEKAVAAKADLSYANLRHTNLSYADLRYTNLSYADLSYANLRYANLSYTNLSYADLSYADLSYADLSYANLSHADLFDGKKLTGDRPFFSVGPIGSRSDYIQAFIADGGLMIRAGCFFDTRDRFELALVAEHGDNEHGQEYRAALVLIDKHVELWTPRIEGASK